MVRPTLEEIYNEPDEFGLLDVKPAARRAEQGDIKDLVVLNDVGVFYKTHQRLPNPDSNNHDEMRLGVIWNKVQENPSLALRQADAQGLLHMPVFSPQQDWQDDTLRLAIPESLDDIFADDELDAAPSLITLKHSTPAAERNQPDHRAEATPCRDFYLFEGKFQAVQVALENGERKASPIRKGAVLEPLEGDFFIRNGLLALVAEKSEKSIRSGSRDHRLRIIFSNATESDPLMSSFRKSLTEDKTARVIERVGLGPLDPEWESDQLSLSGTIYVARSLATDPVIKEQRGILHKIGVTSQDVKRRIADARNDPTFLLAPVEIVATYDLKNLPRAKVENLLHRFFEPARAKGLFVKDRFGKAVYPKEWFYVLPEHVSQAAKLILDGQLHLYRYDADKQKIVTIEQCK